MTILKEKTRDEIFEELVTKVYNPWKNFDETQTFLKSDFDKIIRLKDAFKKGEIGKNEGHKEENQFPLPINGNFKNAKYLLLYSNPSCEMDYIKYKQDLIDCFQLNENAKLVIPNSTWENWYTTQLKKFYNGDDKSFNINKFGEKFCFINFFPYATKSDSFSFSKGDMKIINDLRSTIFIKELVRYGRAMGMEVFVMRLTRGVWLGNSLGTN